MSIKKILRVTIYLGVFLVLWSLLAPVLATNLIIEKPLARADAILVLSGSKAYLERTETAATVFKQGAAPKIFLTNDNLRGGWNEREQRNPFFVERARWKLIEQGVPQEAIEILPNEVAGTHDEADLAIETARERNLQSLLLVTSAYHTRRTLWTFERAARKIDLPLEIGIVSSPNEPQNPPPLNWWLSVQGWQNVGGEYVKTVYYWFFF